MSRRYRNPLTRFGTDTELVLVLAVLGVGGYLIYQLWKGAKAVGTAVGQAGEAIYHGAQVITTPISAPIAAAILKLTEQPAMGGVLGNVLFPDGTAAPLSLYKLYTDQAGGVYVKDRGSTWRLGQSDSDGDWPATYVSG